jgi:hypothetical protein
MQSDTHVEERVHAAIHKSVSDGCGSTSKWSRGRTGFTATLTLACKFRCSALACAVLLSFVFHDMQSHAQLLVSRQHALHDSLAMQATAR